MPQKKKKRPERLMTEARRSRWQREQRWRRIIIAAGCAVIAVVLTLVGFTIYDSAFRPYHEVVLKVDSRPFDMNYYIKMLRLYGIKNAKDASEQNLIAQSVLQVMENSEINRQLAKSLGITATEAEVDAEIEKQLTPPPSASGEGQKPILYADFVKRLKQIGASEKQFRSQVTADVLGRKIREHVGERDVPKETDQAHLRGILIDAATQTSSDDPAEFAARIQATIKARQNAGEGFPAIAEELSTDSSSREKGGDLGWMPREIASMRYGGQFEKTAFELGSGIVSDPISANGSADGSSYWFIEVLGKETARPLEQGQRETLKQKAFQEWMDEQRKTFTIKTPLTPEKQAWAIEKAL